MNVWLYESKKPSGAVALKGLTVIVFQILYGKLVVPRATYSTERK